MKVIMHDGSIAEFTFEDEIGRNALRHTASHILAQAVKRLFPETKLAIGPAIKDGFYYDFDREEAFTDADLEKLEAEMKKITKENLKLERLTLPREEALALVEYVEGNGISWREGWPKLLWYVYSDDNALLDQAPDKWFK